MLHLIFCSFALLIQWTGTSGFNLDTRAPLVYYGPKSSLFGYSVALHRDNNVDWLLVGAPKDNTSQPGISEGGAVYRCPTAPLNSPGDCEKLVLDSEGDDPGEQKSNQYMGATVSSSGANGKVMACAPRFVWQTVDKDGEDLREPVGQCIIASSDFATKEKYTPCKTDKLSDRTLSRITHCQAGFSGEILENGDTVLLGTPGSYYMQGQIYVKTPDGQIDTREGRKVRDDNYRGFAVSYGEFTEDDEPDIVSGAPRGEYLRGQVEVFSSDLQSLYNFTGDQLGEYFGSAVATADVNGDGFDDVIAGAPMYSDERTGYMENWECGRIVIYYQEPNPLMREANLFKEKSDHVLGNSRQARFGYAITSLGDINYDGYEDIAVSAPYGGEDGTGRVYIFNGNASGLILQPTQVISPESIGLTEIKTFGFSLDGNMDADGNNYPDLLIGSQQADSAALVRARPVVHLEPELTITPEGLDLEVKNFQLSDGTMVTSFEVKLCFSYTGSFIPETAGISYSIELDALSVSPRALFYNEGFQDSPAINDGTVLQKGGRPWCLTKTAYVKPSIVEKLAPIQVTVQYDLEENTADAEPHDIFPILSYSVQAVDPKQAFILNNCENNLCVPDLALSETSLSLSSIVIGSSDPVTLNMHISNNGDDAFQASLKAHIPKGLQFIRTEVSESLGISVTCSENTATNVIACDLGNPLMARYQLNLGLTMSTEDVMGDKNNLEFFVDLTSQNEESEDTLADNSRNLTIPVRVVANIRINNASNPEQVQFFSQDSEEEIHTPEIEGLNQIGPQVEHVYDIRNDGPSMVGRTIVDISWPMTDANGKYVLYVVDFEPKESCEIPAGSINPENYPPSAVRTSSYTSAPTERTINKRQVTAQQSARLDCSHGNCINFKCQIDKLSPGQGFGIRIVSRFWNQTFIASGKAKIEIQSTASVQVIQMPYAIAQKPHPFAVNFIETTALPEKPPQGMIPWWIILIAILCGLLFLFLIILLLWKCGFFKRKKYMPVAADDVNGKLAARS